MRDPYIVIFFEILTLCFYAVVSNPTLLYSTVTDIRVVNTSRLNKVNTIVTDLGKGPAVDFLHSKDLICWSNLTAELIQCMSYNETHVGDKVRIVSEGLISPVGIAIDWYTDKIYWTDEVAKKIEVVSIEQGYRKVLFRSEVDLARAIAVVPKEGLMFWTDWGEVPKIERAGMNGDPATRKIIVKDHIFWPNGITIDYDNSLIYWVDAKLHFVDVIDFNGEHRKSVVKENIFYPYALTFFSSKLYWTDFKTWKIYTWDISSTGPTKELIRSDPVPVDIKVYEGSRQVMPSGDYPCKENNGGCSHLCLLAPTPPGYQCACPTGSKLRENNNTTCYNSPQSLLFVAQRSAISKISLDSPGFTPFTLPLKDLRRALTVDFDPKFEYIYWADSLAKTISRARLDGSEQTVVIHSSGVPDSIAIDRLARNIYWTDPVTDTINVARLDGTSRKVIIHNKLYEPRAIALHPTAGWMFWSDRNKKKPKIERANLDGSGRVLLVYEKLTWPNGIALDTVKNKLYWGDAGTHKIEVCNMDGTERKELHSSEILHIFGLTLLGEHLYWTDMQKRTLDRINKNTGLERQTVVEQMANMMGVKAFRLGESLGWNQCADNNGGCSHLCLKTPVHYVCSCPLGLELSKDGKTCVEPEAVLVYSRKNVIGHISIENKENDLFWPNMFRDVTEIMLPVGERLTVILQPNDNTTVMTMILQLLVSTVAGGLTVAGPPEYKQNVAALREARDIMRLNLLSMEGNIPLLNDSRRHYAEIVHVIYYHGIRNSGGAALPYYEMYQKYLNSSAPEAINNPEIVINEVKNLIVTVDNKTSELRDLIDTCVQEDVCNKLIDDTIKENPEQYGHQVLVLFAAGNVANELKNRNSKFEEVSKNLEAHPYVIATPQDLEDIVEAVINLLLIIYNDRKPRP